MVDLQINKGIAAMLEGFNFIGMEMSEEYFKIAQCRIENYEMYREFLDKKKKK
jgi:DNA modification methylase